MKYNVFVVTLVIILANINLVFAEEFSDCVPCDSLLAPTSSSYEENCSRYDLMFDYTADITERECYKNKKFPNDVRTITLDSFSINKNVYDSTTENWGDSIDELFLYATLLDVLGFCVKNRDEFDNRMILPKCWEITDDVDENNQGIKVFKACSTTECCYIEFKSLQYDPGGECAAFEDMFAYSDDGSVGDSCPSACIEICIDFEKLADYIETGDLVW